MSRKCITVQAENDLEQNVKEWINSEAGERDGDDAAEQVLRELLEHGCQSGIVGHLIYTPDCVEFYRAHQREIDRMLNETCQDCGCQPGDLFERAGWDKEDPLAREDQNQNILAWFGFEESARALADREEIEI